MDGAVDTVSVAIVLLSFAVSLLAFGFVRRLDRMLFRPAFWVGAAIATSAACLLLLLTFYRILPIAGPSRLLFVRCGMVFIGLGAGALVQCCASAFACLRPVSSFAMAAKAAMEPVWEFAVASDTSVVAILLISLLFLYLVAVKAKPVRTFKLLKVVYSLAVVLLTVCIALQRLSLDPFMTIAFNADCILLIMMLFLLTTFVANANEAYVCKMAGIAFAAAAVGMALGWVSCKLIYAHFGHDRVYFTIAIACATAVFTSTSFSSRNFPYLTTSGEADVYKKLGVHSHAELLDVCEKFRKDETAASCGTTSRN